MEGSASRSKTIVDEVGITRSANGAIQTLILSCIGFPTLAAPSNPSNDYVIEGIRVLIFIENSDYKRNGDGRIQDIVEILSESTVVL